MTYAQYGLIQASDYNNLVGGDPVTTSGKLNTVWATGGSTAGYGQTPVANVTAGGSVTSVQWANLINKTANAATHQGTSITSVTAPVTGGAITYLSAVPTNLTTIYTNRLNAGSQGSTVANAAVVNTTWSNLATFTHTVSFANGDAARYFFNSGGQLKITCTHSNSTVGINALLNLLAANVGTVILSAPASGTVTVPAGTFSGIAKSGGSNANCTVTLSANTGYYALTTSAGNGANVFYQTAATGSGPAGYINTNINIFAKSNGTQGTNGDAGSIITITTIWDEIPDGLTVGTGSTTTLTAQVPETTYISNTWGTISISSTTSAI